MACSTNLAESTRLISVMATPFMPTIAQQIREQLGAADKLRSFSEEIVWDALRMDENRTGCAVFPKRT